MVQRVLENYDLLDELESNLNDIQCLNRWWVGSDGVIGYFLDRQIDVISQSNAL